MIVRDIEGRLLWKHLFHIALKLIPLGITPEIVTEQLVIDLGYLILKRVEFLVDFIADQSG